MNTKSKLALYVRYTKNNYLDKDDPWSVTLSDTAFSVCSTYHIAVKATPGQLVFGRDMILNIPFISNWEDIRKRKKIKI